MWIVLVSVMVTSGVLGGCMPSRVNLVKTGVVSIQTEAPDDLHLSAAIYAEPSKFIVYGRAVALAGVGWRLGHVDVEVIRPDGALLSAQHVSYKEDFPRRGRYRHATFWAAFAIVPPPGAMITLRHHHGAHNALGELQKGPQALLTAEGRLALRRSGLDPYLFRMGSGRVTAY